MDADHTPAVTESRDTAHRLRRLLLVNFLVCIAAVVARLLLVGSDAGSGGSKFLGVKGGIRGPGWAWIGIEPLLIAGYFSPRSKVSNWARLSVALFGTLGIISLFVEHAHGRSFAEAPLEHIFRVYVWGSHLALAAFWRSKEKDLPAGQRPP
jgi:hypothetical protein